MRSQIDTAAKREKLTKRPAPHFEKIAAGKALGYRATSGQWVARLHKPGKPRRHRTLGHEGDMTYDQALAAALAWFGGAAQAEVPQSKLTVALVASSYLTFRFNETSQEGAKSTKSLFDCHLFGHPLAARTVADLKTAHYQKWLDDTGARLVENHRDRDPKERRRKGRYTANLAWAFFEAALNRAAKIDKTLPKAEWQAVETLKDGETRGRPIFLTEAQVQRLINVTSGSLRDLILGGALTGARLGELTEMKVRDLDFDQAVWHPSHSKTKRGLRPRYLDDQTLALLKRLCAGKKPDALVFSPDGRPWGRRYKHALMMAVEKAKLPSGTSFYSLRHSYISEQMKAGVPPQAIAENCGTSVKQIEDHYGHFAPSAKRKLLARGAMKLEIPATNVVNL